MSRFDELLRVLNQPDLDPPHVWWEAGEIMMIFLLNDVANMIMSSTPKTCNYMNHYLVYSIYPHFLKTNKSIFQKNMQRREQNITSLFTLVRVYFAGCSWIWACEARSNSKLLLRVVRP